MIKGAVARGTATVYGYVPAAEVVDGRLVRARPNSLWFGDPLEEDEVDVGPGAHLVSLELLKELRPRGAEEAAGPTPEGATRVDGVLVETPEGAVPTAEGVSRYRSVFTATAEQLFRILPGLQNLAELSSRFVARVEVEASTDEGFDRPWLRNAVEEHFEEAGVEADTQLK